MCGQRRQIVGVMIHVMAAACLGGATMAAPVVGDHAETLAEEEQHLRVPIIGRQRPAVAKHDRLTFAPVLVKDLNAVFGGDRASDRKALNSQCKIYSLTVRARHPLASSKLGKLSDEQSSAVNDAIREMLSPSESGLSGR